VLSLGGTARWRLVAAVLVAAGFALIDAVPARAPLAVAAPGNDNIASAAIVTSPSTTAVDTTGATLEFAEPQPSCGSVGATVWYAFTAPTSAEITVDTIGSSFDTVLAVYEYAYSSPPLGLYMRTCDDDSGGGTSSSVTFEAFWGVTYFFQLGGKSGAAGDASFSLLLHAENDDIADAGHIDELVYEEDDVPTELATLEPGEPQPCGAIDKTVWYWYEPPVDAAITVSTLGSDPWFDHSGRNLRRAGAVSARRAAGPGVQR
jgi:hypothetical protein